MELLSKDAAKTEAGECVGCAQEDEQVTEQTSLAAHPIRHNLIPSNRSFQNCFVSKGVVFSSLHFYPELISSHFGNKH